jgi:hypothetical protein
MDFCQSLQRRCFVFVFPFSSGWGSYAVAAFRFLLMSPPERPSCLDFLYHIVPGALFCGEACFLHGGTPSCRLQPTSSLIHHFLESFHSDLRVALQLASSPCAASLSLLMISLLPLY